MVDSPKPLSDEELILLHQIVKEYERSLWLRGRAKWFIIWIAGIPAGTVSLLQAFDYIKNWIKGL